MMQYYKPKTFDNTTIIKPISSGISSTVTSTSGLSSSGLSSTATKISSISSTSVSFQTEMNRNNYGNFPSTETSSTGTSSTRFTTIFDNSEYKSGSGSDISDNSDTEKTIELYHGARDETFKKMIVNILSTRSGLKQKYIDSITDEEGMKVFSQAFTHPTINETENYEFYEIIGDSTVNKSIVWYLTRRFPKLRTPQGVPIIARLKICLVSKKTLATLCEKLNVWNFVSSDMDTRQTKMKKTLEDVFEAFLGAVEFLIDSKIKEGAGYSFSYSIIKSLFDEIDISLKYNDLYDAKTRLKELFDFYKNKKIHTFRYETKKIDMFFITEVIISVIRDDGKIVNVTSESGKANLKQDSEQKASENALRLLYNMGIYKPEPEIFREDKI